MKGYPGLFLLAAVLSLSACSAADRPVAIAIHAGAGTLDRADLTPALEAEIRATLGKSVRAGHDILADGGSSLDAVQAAVMVLEDSPHFNAGKGAVFNAEGVNELDASIMDGASENAGAIAAVRRIRNPITLARAVMTDSPHVMLIGDGAESFAAEHGFEFVEPGYFRTEHRWQQLKDRQAGAASSLAPRNAWYSTVGAVARDRDGNLAAATSTGGLTNKRWGRVGDSPIIGAGTYASNRSCAVSGTGTGEYYIRYVVAFRICSLVAAGESISAAADSVINGLLVEAGGDGGVIAMDADGNIAMPHNTPGMYRASIGRDGELDVGIYAD